MISKSSLFLLMATMAVSTVFTGCPGSSGGNDDDDDGGGSGGSPSTVTKITARVENGASFNTEVDNVKVVLEGGFVAGSGTYANGGFTLQLAATVDEQYLNYPDYFLEGVTVSDPNAMAAMVGYVTAYKSGVKVGEFYYDNYSDNSEATRGTDACYAYVDRDVTVKGSGSEPNGDWTVKYTYNMSLKKGWNIVYQISTENEAARTGTFTVSTGTAPAGIRWWYY